MQELSTRTRLLGALLLTLLPAIGQAAAPAPTEDRAPEEIYATLCAMCHDRGDVPRAPHRLEFPLLGPHTILEALETGVMRAQGATLTPTERRAIAEYLGEAKLTSIDSVPVKQCGAQPPDFDFERPPELAGWAMTLEGTRFVANPGLDPKDVPRLAVKWAFAFPGATRARSQPAVGAGALFVGSQDGTVYALDLKTGCARWTFTADSEVRTGPTLESWRRGDRRARPKLYFGDFLGNAYALDARTGALLWKTRVDEHPRLTITGSPRYYGGRLYVPMSSSEWASAADPSYECCTFRGGVAALDAATGKLIWRSYTIPETPRPTGEKNSAGARRLHPAGAPVWNTPTIDVERRRLYVGTGEAYTSPAAPQSDAVIAYDLDTGKMLWWYQSVSGDAWNLACFIGGGANCPEEDGPDVDIGAQIIRHELPDGDDLLLVGQKSGHVFALEPDTGKPVWRHKLGRGGVVGGVHWGIATNGSTLFAPMTDIALTGREEGEPKPGLFALDPATGRTKWYVPAPDVCPQELRPACDRGFSPPPTAMPGVVFQGALDGWLRAYSDADGTLLWSFNTVREFDTVSGAKARGGAIEATGPVVADGSVIVNSGYSFGSRMPGNALIVFSVDGR